MTEKCKWIVRPGTCNSFWAFTTCKPGFNPLTKVKEANQIKDAYENHICPICGKTIEINIELLSEELDNE